VIGPAVYGFLLALYRTKIKLKEKGKEISENKEKEEKHGVKTNTNSS
jgi:hypothetical protein